LFLKRAKENYKNEKKPLFKGFFSCSVILWVFIKSDKKYYKISKSGSVGGKKAANKQQFGVKSGIIFGVKLA